MKVYSEQVLGQDVQLGQGDRESFGYGFYGLDRYRGFGFCMVSSGREVVLVFSFFI